MASLGEVGECLYLTSRWGYAPLRDGHFRTGGDCPNEGAGQEPVTGLSSQKGPAARRMAVVPTLKQSDEVIRRSLPRPR